MADTFKGNRTRPWGRHALIVFVLLLLLLVPAYFMWTASLQRRFDERVAALRASGEPVAPEDFNEAPIPDEENAVVDLRRAWTTLANSTAWKQMGNNPYQLPLSAEDSAAIRAAVEENRSVFEDVAKAAAKPGAHWGVKLTRPVVSVLLPDLNHQHNLSWFLRAAALDAHVRGDDAEAVRTIRHILVQSRLTSRHPFTIAHLTAAGIGSNAAEAVEQIAPDLRVGGAGGATPQQVRALIDDLLEMRALRESFRASLRAERMAGLDSIRGINDGSLPLKNLVSARGVGGGPLLPLTPKPFVLRDALILLDHNDAALAGADAPNLPAHQAALLPMPQWAVSGGGIGHAVARTLLNNYGQQSQNFFRAAAERRLTATILAIRWYAMEHEDKRPAALEGLVPRYLPAVPLDPLAPGEQTIHYITGDADNPPSVYSVGVDGVDQNGSGGSGANRWQAADLVIPLDRPKAGDEAPIDATLMP